MSTKSRNVEQLDPLGFNEMQLCRDGPMIYNKNDQYVGRSLQVYGEFSIGEADLFRQLVRRGSVVVEVGANIGAHTVLLSRLAGPEGAVLAFEPQRVVFQTLCANLALNQCLNVFTHQAGVGAASGSITAPPVDPNSVNNFGGISMQVTGPGEVVPLVTLDGLNLRRCDFLKADVEGMEFDVLLGGEQLIRTLRPLMFIENDREDKSEELLEFIASLDYVAYWHFARLYNPDNFAGEPENIFGNVASINVLCVPREANARIEGFPRVESPRQSWRMVRS